MLKIILIKRYLIPFEVDNLPNPAKEITVFIPKKEFTIDIKRLGFKVWECTRSGFIDLIEKNNCLKEYINSKKSYYLNEFKINYLN